MRVGFATCVTLGRVCIEEILSLGGRIDLLVTLQDHIAPAKSGRVFLDDIAAQHDTPLLKIENINDPRVMSEIHVKRLDWLFIVGWSQIASPALLSAPARGALGMHPTLLPKGRGRASIPWTILKGLSHAGVTLFQLDEGVDTGPVLHQVVIEVDPRETATTLYDKVVEGHVELIRRAWPELLSGSLVLSPQDDGDATYWPARRPSDGEISRTMLVHEVDRLVRASTHPYPGAFVHQQDGSTLTVWSGSPEVPSKEHLELELQDGTYYVSDFEVRSPSRDTPRS